MGVFDALRVSGSALSAGRTRMDVIAENIANVETTRTVEGGPWRRRQVVLRAEQVGSGPGGVRCSGVRVAEVRPDDAPLRRIHNPAHPDANVEGYVEMPNVDLPTEMADMVLAARAYEANAAALRSGREMMQTALSILA
ncbi:MAG: flagellar basal body rod protein FlgC [Armatimonadota bacterium]|jgi:flagellar basal-body rod protein FlgC